MEVVQAYFGLRMEGRNEEACTYFSPDATFETPKERAVGVANILAFINANPANAKVLRLTINYFHAYD